MNEKSQCINSLDSLIIQPNWNAPSNIKAFTTTTYGGVSKNNFQYLNLGTHVGDNLELVLQNRQILQNHIGNNVKLRWLNQIHSNIIFNDDKQKYIANIDADASITTQENIACVVMTADCLPVLLTDGNQIAALHCGWQGLYNNIITKTISLFTNRQNVIAWLAPAITQPNYEVDYLFYNRFVKKSILYKAAFINNRENHYLCDLYKIAQIELEQNNISTISKTKLCTFDSEKLFSYRQNNITGRIATVIYKT